MPREWAEPQLVRMVNVIRHESFYNTGTWIEESMGVFGGWAAVKNSSSDGMPVCNERDDVALVFAGEEFPPRETAARLRAKGHALRDEGPSYLVHLYEEEPGFPAGLNGIFHGFVADRRSGKTTLFNDRYGLRRIYYHESKEAFYFACEAKAILAIRPELRKIDLCGLGEFVSCGCVLENRTYFEGIHVLPAGSSWTFRNGTVDQRTTYFQPSEWENQPSLEPEPYYQQLQKVFSRNLPRYFNGRQRIGVSLTGGLDTRMIMAWQKALPGSLPCYSFASAYRDSQDVVIARRVAAACGQTHDVISVGRDFLASFPAYAERTVYLTDGCAGVDCSADLYVNERARDIAPVRMTGNYGGEVLRGVRTFKPVEPTVGLFAPELVSHFPAVRETYAEMHQDHPLSFNLFRQAPWHNHALFALEQTQLSLRSPYLDNEFVRTVFRAPGSALKSNEVSLRLIADGNPALRRIRTDRGLSGNGSPLSARVVRNLLEFSFKAEYAYDHGMPQWLSTIDHCLSSLHIERLFLGWHKFSHFRIWYRDVLAKYIREMLLDSRTLSRPFLNRKGVEAIVRGHLRGNRNYTDEIHQVLTLEILHRHFIDPQ